ncbi:MAG: 50S ribosomal protein L13 [Candidatus Hinthialibacter antarcticus]|nr:50S ribosomal protein L13 [Candidatus Hinthialibacter antarcticus]
MKSHIATQKEIQQAHKVHLIDAEGKVMGRLASEVARLLTGKNKPIYTPFLDTGDHVIIINADKVRLTGNKLEDKNHTYHTGYPGGLKQSPYRIAMADKPVTMVTKAIWGMLPKTRLGRQMLKKLRVYKGPRHPHTGQKPVPLEVKA